MQAVSGKQGAMVLIGWQVHGVKRGEGSPRQVGARSSCEARHWEDKGSWWWVSIRQCPPEGWLQGDTTVAGGVPGSGVVTQRTHSTTRVCLIWGLQRRIEQEKGPRSQGLLLSILLSSMTSKCGFPLNAFFKVVAWS